MASRIPAFACLLLAAASLASRPLVADERPNILFIFTDDQAPWALGAAEYPHAKTPHMDRLVREGAYLVNSFTTTPVCSPSRASLLTSRYGSELGITDWLHDCWASRWASCVPGSPRIFYGSNVPCTHR